jgi:hypothetical protein
MYFVSMPGALARLGPRFPSTPCIAHTRAWSGNQPPDSQSHSGPVAGAWCPAAPAAGHHRQSAASGSQPSAALSLSIGTFCNVITTLWHRHCHGRTPPTHAARLTNGDVSAPPGHLARGGEHDDEWPGLGSAGSASAGGLWPAMAAGPAVAATAVQPGRSPAADGQPAVRIRGPAAAGSAAFPAAGPAVATAGIPAPTGTSRMAAARIRSAAAYPPAARAEAKALARSAQGSLRTYRSRRDRHHRRRRILVEQAVNAGRGQHRRGEQPCIPGGGTVILRGGTVILRCQFGSEHARCSR